MVIAYARIAGLRLGAHVSVPGEEVDAPGDASTESLPVDARVEQGHGHAASIDAGESGMRAGLAGGGVDRDSGRINGPDWIDTDHSGRTLERRGGPSVEHGREAIQRAGEDVLPLHRDTSDSKRLEKTALESVCLGHELPLCPGRELLPGGGDPVGKGGRRQHDDHAPPDVQLWP